MSNEINQFFKDNRDWMREVMFHVCRCRVSMGIYSIHDGKQDYLGAILEGYTTPKSATKYLDSKPYGYSYSGDPLPLEQRQERALLRELGVVVGEALGNKRLGRVIGVLLARKRKLLSISEVAKASGYTRNQCEEILDGVEATLIYYLETQKDENPDGFLSNDVARLQKQERMARSAPQVLEKAPS